MFRALSQNNQHLKKKKCYQHAKANGLRKIKNGIKISVGQSVLELLVITFSDMLILREHTKHVQILV